MALITRGAKAGGGTNYNAGQIITHTEKNTDFNTLYSEVNGNLQNVNFATNAAIATTKLAFSGCRVTNSTDISLSSSFVVLMTWDTETYDTDDYHSTVANKGRLTAPTTGKYLIVAAVTFSAEASPADSIRRIEVRRNSLGSPAVGDRIGMHTVGNAAGGVFSLSFAFTHMLTASEYVELFALQISGETLNASLTSAPSHFSITRLGA